MFTIPLEFGTISGTLEADCSIGIPGELFTGGTLLTLFIPGGATYLDFLRLLAPDAPALTTLPPTLNVGGGGAAEMFEL